MAVWRRQSGRGSPGRYDFWTRASLYALLAAVPLVALSLAAGQRHARAPGVAVFVLLSAAQAAVCVALLHASLSRYLATGPRPKSWLVASAIALTAAGVLAAAAFPAFTRPPAGVFPVSSSVAMLFGGALTVALTPLLSLPSLVALILAGAGAASGMSAVSSGADSHGHAIIGAFLVYALVVGGVVAVTGRATAWTLRVMWELDRSRATHARLSVAEERLRFARDLHDVLGRNLSLIAVKCQLAAQLARQGDEEAAGQMLEVRRVAHESLREMRAVVSGYRIVDLDTEMAGAQAVLRSAGASCRIIGDAAGLPAQVQAALGWVVREGTTNIIRHSDATACTIELHVPDASGTAGTVTLRMDNDRVRTPDAAGGGTGLLGLSERLAGLGGTITTRYPRSGHFRLEATLPASGTAAMPSDPGQPSTSVIADRPAP